MSSAGILGHYGWSTRPILGNESGSEPLVRRCEVRFAALLYPRELCELLLFLFLLILELQRKIIPRFVEPGDSTDAEWRMRSECEHGSWREERGYELRAAFFRSCCM